MRSSWIRIGGGFALAVLCASFAMAQPPQGGPGGFGGGGTAAGAAVSSAVANPTYTTILLEKDVNRPAAEVWKRVGKYCDIGEWLQVQCMITSGKDGEVGAVRSIGREILVGKTDLSYTYTQPVTAGRPYDLYHGTLEVKPVTATTSKIVYTLLYDNSMLADDAAREADKTRRTTMFTRAVDNMKILAEGGTLPAAPARGGGGGRGGGAPGGGQGRGGPAGPGGGAPGGGAPGGGARQ
jgi:hypothetical protein